MTTASNPFRFPNTKNLSLEEATKALALKSDKAEKIKEWIEPYHKLLVDAVESDKRIIFIAGKTYNLRPANNPLYYCLYPADGTFVPMAQFSVDRLKRELKQIKVEVL